MAYELRDGQGTLFKNDRKSTEKHPDYTGSIKTPDGQEHWFSAWIKTGSQGGKFLSVQIGNPKDGQRKPPAGVQPPMGNAPQGRRSSMKDSMDDEIPFAPEWR
jgi:hypothetical protein